MANAGHRAEDIARARQDLLKRILSLRGDEPVVEKFEAAPGGNSRETWIATVRHGGVARRVVLRCDPDNWIRPLEMEREISGLRLACDAGVPVPRVLAAWAVGQTERPYVVTEFVAGTAIARRIQRDAEYATARDGFVEQCASVLARLHGAGAMALDWPHPDPLVELRDYAALATFASPVLLGALRWLEDNRPTANGHSPVPAHRDFRLGNIMVDRAGIVAVLDWETCHLSDPEEDLAWLCSRAWRYGGSGEVGGLGDAERLLEAYEAASSRRVDRVRLHWWAVYAETRWGLASIARPPSAGTGDSMERAAITRRACLQEHHVLEALAQDVAA